MTTNDNSKQQSTKSETKSEQIDAKPIKTEKKYASNKKKKEEEVYISFSDNSYFDKIKQIEEKLKNYIIDNYDVDNDKISRKYIHTFKTKLVNDQIIMTLNFNDREKYLSSIIALFHDYGRFEQVRIYDSFNDLTTVDHADLAVEMLFDKKEIFNFVQDLTEEELNLVKIAIKNHNKFEVEEGLIETQNLFCKIIRDADKVDIYRVITTEISAKDNVQEGKLEQSILDNFYAHKLYRYSKETTFYTSAITKLSFIYDINFTKSYELILQNDYLNKYMYALLLETPFKIDENLIKCFNYAQEYMKKQVENSK